MAYVLVALFAVMAVAGLIALLLVIFAWKHISGWYPDLVPKIIIALARVISGGAAIAVKFAAPNDLGWVHVQLATIISYALWEITGVVGDQKSKKGAKRAEKLEKEGLFRTKLLTTLRGLVKIKQEKIRDTLSSSSAASATIPRAKAALAPERQIAVILEHLALLLKSQVPETEEALHQNFRVGLCVENNGFVVPVESFDLNNRNYAPFSSYQVTPRHFQLGNATDPSAVVTCVNRREMLIISDCGKAAEAGDFVFFNDLQKTYLKSMAACPIFISGRQVGTMVQAIRAAIVIDTDVAGHFKDEDRAAIKFVVEEFSTRLNLELLIRDLL